MSLLGENKKGLSSHLSDLVVALLISERVDASFFLYRSIHRYCPRCCPSKSVIGKVRESFVVKALLGLSIGNFVNFIGLSHDILPCSIWPHK